MVGCSFDMGVMPLMGAAIVMAASIISAKLHLCMKAYNGAILNDGGSCKDWAVKDVTRLS